MTVGVSQLRIDTASLPLCFWLIGATGHAVGSVRLELLRSGEISIEAREADGARSCAVVVAPAPVLVERLIEYSIGYAPAVCDGLRVLTHEQAAAVGGAF